MRCRHQCFGSRVYRVASIGRGFGCPIPDSAGSSLLEQVCPEGLHPWRERTCWSRRGAPGTCPLPLSFPVLLREELEGKEWWWTLCWKGGRKGVVLLLVFASRYLNIYIYIYIWQYIKIFFPKLSLLSFMPATVTGKQSPSLYLSPWAFSFYFHPVSHWGGKVNEQVGGHLVVSQG